jgi:phosphomannomutase
MAGKHSRSRSRTFFRRAAAYGQAHLRAPTVGGLFTFFCLVALTVFVFSQLQPSDLFKQTLTDGGDMGAHVYLPWFMRHFLLPHGRITGWSSGWYDGFPIFTFYFPLPSLLIALASFVIPYTVAFKLITVSGLLIMPVSAWAMGKLAGWEAPVPVALAASTLPLLFERSFTIDGANIASTMAGEYSFAISLSLALVLLGLVVRGLDTGRHRALAAVLFAFVAMCHVLPAMFVGGAALLVLLLRFNWRRLWWGLSAGLAGVAITAVWLLPFKWRIGYSTDMGWSPVTDYMKCLFPYDTTSQCTTTSHAELVPFQWFVGVAAVGAAISILRWVLAVVRRGWGAKDPHLLGVVFTAGAAASALVFRFAPTTAVYNARALPFWFLCIYLLCGVALGEVAAGAGWLWRHSRVGIAAARWWMGEEVGEEGAEPGVADPGYPARRWPAGALVGSLVATVAALWWVALPLPAFSFLPGSVPVAERSFVPAWVSWNYSGYQSRAAWPEYHALMETMGSVGRRYGCGPAMWEYDPNENNFGTTMSLMLLPYWTDGCIGSMEGLLFESSSTTPYHFINQSELSDTPSEAMSRIPYAGMNVPLGITHLRQLGVRYFMAFSYDVVSQAMRIPGVKLVATSGPWTGAESFTGSTVTWDVFELEGSSPVTPMAFQPAVMSGPGAGATGQAWLDASMAWYTNPSDFDVPLVASGPSGWQKVEVRTDEPSSASSGAVAGEQTTISEARRIPLPVVRVTDVRATNDTVRFHVSRVGVPVEVHVSYFPNWQVVGGIGPFRATPNEMVVVPTSKTVTLHYGYTPVDLLGWLLTLAGLAAALVMWRRPPLAVETRPGRRGGAGLAPWPGSTGRLATAMETSSPRGTKLDRIFKAYDVRGVVGEDLDYETSRAIGSAFAIFLRLGGHLGSANRILVARDMRESGVELAGGFIAGARSQGVDVVDLGLASTDMGYFAAGRLDAPCAIFTASHNPARYNGIKLCLAGAKPIGQDSGLADIKQIASGILGTGNGQRDGAVEDARQASGPVRIGKPAQGSLTSMSLLDAFAAHVRSFVDVSKLAGLSVVADTANGMGGLVVPAVFSGLDVKLEILYPELDGNFPNHPADPIQVENLADLREKVVSTGADVGLAFDGDADRVFLVDERGEPLSGSLTTAMVAKSMLAKHPGSTILYNLICSKVVPEVIAECGGIGVRTRVGHSFIKATMAETGAVFGGEHSGHYYFRENYRADSGLIAALIVLEMIASEGKPLSEMRVPFERYAASGEINSHVPDPAGVIDRVQAYFESEHPEASFDRLDGLTVDMGDWWFNLRPSNTEPLLRLNLEAADRASCDTHVAEVLALLDTVGSPR